MADTFTSTVDGTVATFNVLYEVGGGARQVRGEGSISVRLLPYGPSPSVVVQSAGGMPVERTYKLYVASQSDLNNLLHCRGHHGNLVSTEVGSLDCTLRSAIAAWEEWDLQHQDVTASFVSDTV